jgi:beta-N-acetylhexosaminidase
VKAAIVGIAGLTLLPDERALFRAVPPAGIILFRRNIADPAQLSALIAALRRVLPPNAVFMVDQEGGRVARLRPPHWRDHPAARTLGHVFDRDPKAALRAAWLTGALIGADCRASGFTVTAAPVLDLSIPGAHDVIGDRALAEDPAIIARLGRAVAAGIAAAGVQSIG